MYRFWICLTFQRCLSFLACMTCLLLTCRIGLLILRCFALFVVRTSSYRLWWECSTPSTRWALWMLLLSMRCWRMRCVMVRINECLGSMNCPVAGAANFALEQSLRRVLQHIMSSTTHHSQVLKSLVDFLAGRSAAPTPCNFRGKFSVFSWLHTLPLRMLKDANWGCLKYVMGRTWQDCPQHVEMGRSPGAVCKSFGHVLWQCQACDTTCDLVQLGTWMEGRLGHAVDTMYTCRIHVEYM